MGLPFFCKLQSSRKNSLFSPALRVCVFFFFHHLKFFSENKGLLVSVCGCGMASVLLPLRHHPPSFILLCHLTVSQCFSILSEQFGSVPLRQLWSVTSHANVIIYRGKQHLKLKQPTAHKDSSSFSSEFGRFLHFWRRTTCLAFMFAVALAFYYYYFSF